MTDYRHELPWTDSVWELDIEVTADHFKKAIKATQLHGIDPDLLCTTCVLSTALEDIEGVAAAHTGLAQLKLVPETAEDALDWIGPGPWSFHMPGGGRCVDRSLTEQDVRDLYLFDSGIAVRFKLGSRALRSRELFDEVIQLGYVPFEMVGKLTGNFTVVPFPEYQKVGASRPGWVCGNGKGPVDRSGHTRPLRAVTNTNGQTYWPTTKIRKAITKAMEHA